MIGKVKFITTNKPPRRETLCTLGDGRVVKLPQSPGHYLALVSDWGYAACWFVHVSADPPAHLERLRRERPNGGDHYIYTADDGTVLTMYFEGATRAGLNTHHVPPVNPDTGRPWADGYVRYEWKFEDE